MLVNTVTKNDVIIEEVETYLSFLAMQLMIQKVNSNYIKVVVDSIRIRMLSIIKVWDDKESRNGLLLVGLEEGMFYKPFVSSEINSFVVITIRNSLLEELCTFGVCRQGGIFNPLSELVIKEITSKALYFFEKFNFAKANEVLKSSYYDYYQKINSNYPKAWSAIKDLANMPLYIKNRVRISGGKKISLSDFSYINTDSENSILKSGMSEAIDEQLKHCLDNVKQIGVFWVYCFKMLTRNYGFLLKLIEYILQNDGDFCTENYLISNSYVQKRKDIISARKSAEFGSIKSLFFIADGTTGIHRQRIDEHNLQYRVR